MGAVISVNFYYRLVGEKRGRRESAVITRGAVIALDIWTRLYLLLVTKAGLFQFLKVVFNFYSFNLYNYNNSKKSQFLDFSNRYL